MLKRKQMSEQKRCRTLKWCYNIVSKAILTTEPSDGGHNKRIRPNFGFQINSGKKQGAL